MTKQPTGSPKPEDIITWKMNSDPVYEDKIIGNYEFAKQEFETVGLTIDPKNHQELKASVASLRAATEQIFSAGGWRPRINVILIRPPIERVYREAERNI